VFPLFGAFYYWFPLFTGRMLDETLGRWPIYSSNSSAARKANWRERVAISRRR
jgi:hypothetical protein